jgi:alkylation response protein AidB-like acyl-CoA dehydrogenase
MAQVIAERRDIDFALHEQFEVGKLSAHEKFKAYTKKMIDMVVSESRNLSVKELLPTLKIGDEAGCRYEKGRVITPEGYKRAWDLLVEGEWYAMDCSTEWGGQGMPESVAMAARDYLLGANLSILMVGMLNRGAGRLIEVFGTDQQKEKYLQKVYSGKWGATMALTEPEAGSDLSSLTTTATPNGDGTYNIVGNKIFISGGEHDMAENIIHPVLARIEGAPAGSAGLSLFLVPKFFVNDDGSLGEANDVVCTGIEEKMGLHGSPTCSMAFGSKGKCVGTLLGKEHSGLAAMFHMMNETRLISGAQALSLASSSYLHAVAYARTRMQGAMIGTKDKQQMAIINHPDVRRMLLKMKMYVEGMRSLLYFISLCEDQKLLTDDAAQRDTCQNLIDILIPIGKGYVTDRGIDICNLGIQTFGGYGYTSEYPAEQLFRDVRVTAIYEGTNGIQAMDLLGRKLRMKGGRLLEDLTDRIRLTIDSAQCASGLKQMAEKTGKAVTAWHDAARKLAAKAQGAEANSAFVHAYPLMTITGDVVMAWMLLWRAHIATQKLADKPKKKDVTFYEGQLKSAEFFIRSVLPVTHGKIVAVLDACSAPVEIADSAFGGK